MRAYSCIPVALAQPPAMRQRRVFALEALIPSLRGRVVGVVYVKLCKKVFMAEADGVIG